MLHLAGLGSSEHRALVAVRKGQCNIGKDHSLALGNDLLAVHFVPDSPLPSLVDGMLQVLQGRHRQTIQRSMIRCNALRWALLAYPALGN